LVLIIIFSILSQQIKIKGAKAPFFILGKYENI